MKALVKRYKQDTKGIDGKLRDQLILDYASLIRFIAQKVSVKLPSNTVQSPNVASPIVILSVLDVVVAQAGIEPKTKEANKEPNNLLNFIINTPKKLKYKN